MGGGLMQLVAYGAQDIYLTGQPQITFFKSVYRRHTNFAVESILQTINGSSNAGSQFSVTISRNGDLLSDVYIQLPATLSNYSKWGGYAQLGSYERLKLIDYAELEIGGQVINKVYGDWMRVWSELAIRKMNSSADPLASCLNLTSTSSNVNEIGADNIYIPLQFWFSRNPGLAIPLIALQYHEVKLNIRFKTGYHDTSAAIGTGPITYEESGFTANFATARVYADYIYLDTTERRQFAQNAHEYLIEQQQTQTDIVRVGSNTLRLNFNHPVKYITWYIDNPNNIINTGSSSVELTNSYLPYKSAKIVLNGTDRFTERERKYFSTYQVYQYWPTNSYFPDYNCNYETNSIIPSVYSFAIRPAEHQPSGTCNFSRIDTAQLHINGVETSSNAVIYVTNYNVLRIMSGMGGLAYSN